MKTPSPLSRAAELFWQFLTAVVVACFSLMLAIMMVQVIARHALSVAVPWTDEASRYFFLAAIFLGAVLAQRRREHIAITILTDVLPAKVRRVLAGVSDAICIGVAAMLLYGALVMMERTAGIYASTFQLSFSWIYSIQFAGLLAMMLLSCRDLFARACAAGACDQPAQRG